jgi:hypothetical protein
VEEANRGRKGSGTLVFCTISGMHHTKYRHQAARRANWNKKQNKYFKTCFWEINTGEPQSESFEHREG